MNAEHTLLENKIAIVTGGGSGIGRAIALALAQAGVQVVICGRRFDKLEETAGLLQAATDLILPVQADVSQPEDVTRLLETTLAAFGRVDIMINNAGIADDAGAVHEIDLPV
jgi:3-oxoacyl-[acyl-carrier protein] reductase